MGALQSSREAAAARATDVQDVVALLERNDVAGAARALEPVLRASPADPLLQNLAGVDCRAAWRRQHRRTALPRGHPAGAGRRLALSESRPVVPGAGRPRRRRDRQGAGRVPVAAWRAIRRTPKPAIRPPTSWSCAGTRLRRGRCWRSFRSACATRRRCWRCRWRCWPSAGDAAGATRVAATLAAHPDFVEADIAGLLPVLTRPASEAHGVMLLEALDRRGLASPSTLRQLGALQLRTRRPADARKTLERVAAAGRADVALLMDLGRAAYAERDSGRRHSAISRGRGISTRRRPPCISSSASCAWT